MAEYQISAVLKARDAGLTATLKSAAKAAEGLGKSVTSGVEKGVKGVEKGVKGVTSQQIVAKAGVEGLAKIERLKGAMEAARAATARPMDLRINSGDLAKITRLGQETARPIDIRARDDASSKLQKIRSELASLTGKAWTAVVNIKNNGAAALGKMKAGASELAGGAALAMGAPILGMAGVSFGAVNAVQSQMDFEKQMSTVKAIISSKYRDDAAGLEKTMELLTAKAEEMGATTKFTAKEAAEGLYYMGMAGWGAQQMLAGLPPVLKLAIAGNAELGRTSDIVTDSMTAFGLKAGTYIKNSKGDIVEASQFYADLFGALITNANTDVYGAGEALKYAAPAVQAMYANGTDTDKLNGAQDLFWVLGLMANSGIKGSQAGTSARAMFTRLGSQNRNAYFADNALGVDFVGENGEVRRLRDIVSDFQNVVRNGVDMDKVSDFFEQISGEKIHADTRRKLNAYLENVQANGGKMSGAELMKMVSMLSGQEAMSGWLAAFLAPLDEAEGLFSALENAEGTLETMSKIQMDNLAGSFVLLSSAWDAFQRNLVKGEASKGLRSFVDSVTDTLSKANRLFEDGIDIGDFGAIIIDVIAKLKAKFLELDGIGSILAGGALVMGLKKILSLALNVKETLATWSKVRSLEDAGNAIRGNKTATGGLQNINGLNLNASTVNIRAGVVNVSGPIKGGGGGGGVVKGGGVVNSRGNVRIDSAAAYYDRRAAVQSQLPPKATTVPPVIPPAATPPAATTGATSVLKGGLKAGAGMGVLTVILGAMDIAATRADNQYRVDNAQQAVVHEQEELALIEKYEADPAQIEAQKQKIAEAEAAVAEITKAGEINERHAEAGAAGAVTGTMLGAAIGSFVPVLGTTIGAVIGGILGERFGVKMSDKYAEKKAAEGDEIKTTTTTALNESAAQINTTTDATQIGTRTGGHIADFNEITSGLSAAIESAKASVSAGFNEISSGISSAFEGAKSAVSGVFEEINTTVTSGVSMLKTGAVAAFDEIGTTISTGLEAAGTAVSGFAENIYTTLGTGFETLKMAASTAFEEISVSVSTGLETLLMSASTALEGVSLAFSGAFESILTAASSAFASLSATVSAGVEVAYSAITSAFSSAAAEVEGIWSGVSGFFSGVFGGLGGIAAAAGSAIAAGINSGIGVIQGAWEALSGWLSAKIASISAMASSSAASVGIGANYSGTSNWSGGFTTVNEHGGELIILPNGQIITPYHTASAVFNSLARTSRPTTTTATTTSRPINTTRTTTRTAANRAFNTANSSALSTASYGGRRLFSGSWTEASGTGSELMFLPTGTKIIPHATTVSILRREIRKDLAGFEGEVDELGNLLGVAIPEYNRITADDSLLVRRAKIEAQRRSAGIAQNYSGTSFFRAAGVKKDDVAHNYSGTSFFRAIKASDLGEIAHNYGGTNYFRAGGGGFKGEPEVAHNYNGTNYFRGDRLGFHSAGRGADKFNLGRIFGKKGRLGRIFSSSSRVNWGDIFRTAINFGDIFRTAMNLGGVLRTAVNFSGGLEGGGLNPVQAGDLPAPNFTPSSSNLNTTTTTTDNSKNTSSRTSANFNFGDIHITSGMDFEEFAHRLARLFTQSSANFAG